MSAKKTDISQIRKYLKGELDARAMHQLEREALDDPFLMDAIEGYSMQHTDQQAQLDELQQKLQQRVSKGKVYQMPYRMVIGIAASVLIILSATYLLWPSRRRAQVKQIAAAIPKTPAPATLPDTVSNPLNQQQLAANTVPATKRNLPQPDQVSQATNPSNPANSHLAAMAVTTNAMPAADVKKPDTVMARSSIPNDSLNTNMALAAIKQPSASNPEPVKMMRAAVMAKAMSTINGLVSDETGHPLAGTSVTEKGKTEGVKTDSKGKFSIPGHDGELLNITHQGYDTKEVKGDTHDSLNVILRSANQSISEMVAIGFGRAPAAAQQTKTAHPQIGWDKYNAYLKTLAVVYDGHPGMVKLSFTIDDKGRLDNFKITRSVTPATDQSAINMVKNGPAWLPNVNGKTTTISLKIEFKQQQP